MRTKWRTCCAGLSFALLGTICAAADGTGDRPNVIVIVSDDQGYGDVGYQGMRDISTPAIDALALSGIRFSNGYVSCPVCSPTRAGLMTGRYQQRFGHEFNPGPGGYTESFGLPLTEATIADRMKMAGYVTGIVGKWHLGSYPSFSPLRRGFDEFFGFPGGGHDYFEDEPGSANPLLRGTKPIEENEYLTDAFTREAVAFVQRHAKERFFLYLAYNAVHAPLQAPTAYLDRFAHIVDERRRTHAAMMFAMDDGIGKVLAKLREEGIENNTLIFFLSDNGGPTSQTTSRNGPLRGQKGQVTEGGIRVPFLMSWPGRLPAGRTYEHPVIALDILPTAVAAAGGRVPERLDGVNLLAYLDGEKSGAPHQTLFWRFGGQRAVRHADWKLIRRSRGDEVEAVELYDLRRDVGEKKNLANVEPEKVQQLTAMLNDWEGELAEPLWRTRGLPEPGNTSKRLAPSRGSRQAEKESAASRGAE
jgi:arylsulfatase A-like enzyme